MWERLTNYVGRRGRKTGTVLHLRICFMEGYFMDGRLYRPMEADTKIAAQKSGRLSFYNLPAIADGCTILSNDN